MKEKKLHPTISDSRSAVRVLVLGTSGMLGSMVYRHLSSCAGIELRGTVREPVGVDGNLYAFDAAAPQLDEKPFSDFKPDFVINCIGIIKPHCKDDDAKGVVNAITINALFPHKLAALADKFEFRTIQIATDCVYSGTKGSYLETDPHDALDVYGKTKSLGEVRHKGFLNIRTSIIGPEEKGKYSLLEWFFSQKEGGTIKGFAHHRWNGVTTLQFAKLVEDIVRRGPEFFDSLVTASPVHHFVPNTAVDKYELMKLFVGIFGRSLTVERVDNVGPAVDRTLGTKFTVLCPVGEIPMEKVLRELAEHSSLKKNT